jgi:type III pantothenate kinase
MLLAIDIGNTRIKCAVFEQDTILEQYTFDKKEAQKNFKQILKKYSNIEFSIFSSVVNLDISSLDYLKKHTFTTIVNHESILPFRNLYKTPKTLGIDRMVLASGATLLFPNRNCLIIDAGTCITFDFINAQNQYLGGAISPGINMRYKALHTYTSKLPLIEMSTKENLIGKTTEESINSGVINGVIFEIEGFISQYSLNYQDLTIILTGGDVDFLAKRLKSTIFANSNFLLQSLNELFKYIKLKNE